MVEQIKETKQVVAETVVAKITKCDVCGKIICDSRHVHDILRDKVQDHYELSEWHNDWGNDSVDSIETFDICSKECLRKKFEAYVEESSGGQNTMHFEVDHSWNYMRKDNGSD